LTAEQRPSRTVTQRNIRRSMVKVGDLGIVSVVCYWPGDITHCAHM